jgi:hypothetical protein
MRKLFMIFSAISVCRIVLSGESSSQPTGPPDMWRLADYGVLGLFTLCLLYDRWKREKKDDEKEKARAKADAERQEKDEKTAARFHELDKQIITANKDSTIAMGVMAKAANELESSVQGLTKVLYTKPCLRPKETRSRGSDERRHIPWEDGE